MGKIEQMIHEGSAIMQHQQFLIAQRDAEISRLQGQLREERRAAEQARSEARGELMTARAKAVGLRKRLDAERSKSESREERADGLEREVSDAQERVEELERELDGVNKTNERLRGHLDDLHEELEDEKDRVRGLEVELGEARGAIDALSGLAGAGVRDKPSDARAVLAAQAKLARAAKTGVKPATRVKLLREAKEVLGELPPRWAALLGDER